MQYRSPRANSLLILWGKEAGSATVSHSKDTKIGGELSGEFQINFILGTDEGQLYFFLVKASASCP